MAETLTRAPATPPQLTKLVLLFADLDVDNREDRLWLLGQRVGRPLDSSTELAKDEAHRLIELLEHADPAAVAATLATRCDACEGPVPGTLCCADHGAVMCPDCRGLNHPAELAGPQVLCARGTPSERDRAVIAAFGAELELRAEIAAMTPEQVAAELLPGGRATRRAAPGCGPHGYHWVPAGERTRSCPCGTVTRVPAPDRYCMPEGVCYCGKCAHWTPVPAVNYAAAIRALAEDSARKAGRRR